MSIRMRAKEQGGLVTVKALVKHPMETGQRKDKSGNKIPEHFIQQITAKANGEVIMEAQWSPAVSKNPYLAFQYDGKKGDTIEIAMIDNEGQTFDGKGKVK
ncbi:MAG TPA: thiosulfate oxidation carrier complex protein SoxZ [Deltaproteobacteria bacterium]|jgi:sulfur-oxidizing protein SoxZ|nr:MAG: thiosulfate oxidation carrier complex protein SoxZ [Pseudomonadota bacterium]HBM51841.1 thiosulfate oxidation carrier complex protein SoxZ [Deltaproteobacteria bacterium]